MIIDRITAVRVVPQRVATRQVPVGTRPREIETASVVGSGERLIAEGTTGNVLDVSYDEVEIDLYAPRDLTFYIQPTVIGPA